MNNQTARESAEIDCKTSRSICDAVGERLQRELRPETSRPSVYLQHLLDELRRRDQDSRLPNPAGGGVSLAMKAIIRP